MLKRYLRVVFVCLLVFNNDIFNFVEHIENEWGLLCNMRFSITFGAGMKKSVKDKDKT